MFYAIAGTLGAGLATGLGALMTFAFPRSLPHKAESTMLGVAAGIMLAATVFSLIAPAIEIGGIAIASAGIALGAVVLHLADKLIPHDHPAFGGRENAGMRAIFLFVIAITLHNFPEGLAVGISYGQGEAARGNLVALAIGLQNVPEGLAVALALVRAGYPRWKAFLWALATGLVEPPAGFMGLGLVGLMASLLPWGLAFAGGAMLFVISDEIIPETHSQGKERWATAGLIAGFILMMILDNAFG
jgi:ZIP family zinc transporter